MPIYNFPINNGFDIREYTIFRDEKTGILVNEINTYETILNITGEGFVYNAIATIGDSSTTGKLRITIDGTNYITCKLNSGVYCGFSQESSIRGIGEIGNIISHGSLIQNISFNDDTASVFFIFSSPIIYYQSFKIEVQSSSLANGVSYRYFGGNK